MKIAISVKNNSICNLLDSSDEFIIIDTEKYHKTGELSNKIELNFNKEDIYNILSILKQYNVELLLCGIISHCLERYLRVLNIRFYGFLQGDYMEIVEYFMQNGSFQEHHIINNERYKHLLNKEENYVFSQRFKCKRCRRRNGQRI